MQRIDSALELNEIADSYFMLLEEILEKLWNPSSSTKQKPKPKNLEVANRIVMEEELNEFAEEEDDVEHDYNDDFMFEKGESERMIEEVKRSMEVLEEEKHLAQVENEAEEDIKLEEEDKNENMIETEGLNYQEKIKIRERLLQVIDNELEKLTEKENRSREEMTSYSLGMDMNLGYALLKLLQILTKIVEKSGTKPETQAELAESTQEKEKKEKSYMYYTIKSFLKVRKIVGIKTYNLELSEQILGEMFSVLNRSSDSEKKTLILECLRILLENISSQSQDQIANTFLYEELCKIISPPKESPTYLLILNKSPSQDIFIRGNMTKNPYKSTDFDGSLISHVRSKICHDLELTDAEELMELLVGNQLLDLDLPINLVYEQVWWPYLARQRNPDLVEIPSLLAQCSGVEKMQLEPMIVVYRLAGLDGEATEARVSGLKDASDSEMQEEVMYRLCDVVALDVLVKEDGMACSGISIMLRQLRSIRSLQSQRYLSQWVIRLLYYATRLQVNRVKVSLFVF